MICYVIGEKTAGYELERNVENIKYVDYLMGVGAAAYRLKKAGYDRFVICSDGEFVEDFRKAVLHFYGSAATVEFESGLPKEIKEDDSIVWIRDGIVFRKEPTI